MLFNFELALIDVVLGNITQPAIIIAVAISIVFIILYVVYVPEPLYTKIVYEPSVETVGEPVILVVYSEVNIFRITTPEPPRYVCEPAMLKPFPPPPEPVLAVPDDAT